MPTKRQRTAPVGTLPTYLRLNGRVVEDCHSGMPVVHSDRSHFLRHFLANALDARRDAQHLTFSFVLPRQRAGDSHSVSAADSDPTTTTHEVRDGAVAQIQ